MFVRFLQSTGPKVPHLRQDINNANNQEGNTALGTECNIILSSNFPASNEAEDCSSWD